MRKLLLNIFLGFALAGAGIFTGYLFLKTLNDLPNWLFLLATLILLGGGIYFLLKAGKADDSVISKPTLTGKNPDAIHPLSVIEMNSQIAKEWNRTLDTRDRLKLLEAAGAAEEEK